MRTGHGCRRCSSGSSPRSSRASACRPRRRRCCARRCRADRRRRDRRADAGRPLRQRASGGRRGGGVGRIGRRARPHLSCRRGSRGRLAIADVRASASRRSPGRSQREPGALVASATREWDGALGPDAPWTRSPTLVPADGSLSPTSLENYANCPQRFLLGAAAARPRRSRSPSGRCGSTRFVAATCSTGSSSASTASGRAPVPASLAPDAEQRMRAIAGEECDAAAARGETGYPAMWAADRIEVIEDCLQLARGRARGPERPASSRSVAVRGAVRTSACPGEEVGTLSRDEPIEIERRRAHTPAGRPDRPDQLGRTAADALPGDRLQDRQGPRREAGELQGGRMLQLPLYALAGAKLLGLDPTAGEAAYVYPTRRGEFNVVAWTSRGTRRPARGRDRRARCDPRRDRPRATS